MICAILNKKKNKQINYFSMYVGQLYCDYKAPYYISYA